MSRWPVLAFFRPNAWNVFRRNLLAWRRYAWSSVTINFAEPFLYFLAIGFGLGTYVRLSGGASFVQFLAAGLLAAMPMNVATFDAAWGAYERMNTNGVYEAMVTAPVEAGDIAAGEILWQAFRALVYGALFLIVMAIFGLVHSWWALLALVVLALTGMMFAIPALYVAMSVPYQEQLFYYFSLAITPMFMTSGVFFPLDRLPHWALDAVWLSPLYHAVNLTRELVDGRPTWSILEDLAWMVAFIVLLMPLPMWTIRTKLATS
jgi:lipooligosaccharide transport system permease protein